MHERGAVHTVEREITRDRTVAGGLRPHLGASKKVTGAVTGAALEHFAPAIGTGVDAVSAASVLHYSQLEVGQVTAALAAAGHPVREAHRAGTAPGV